jgi:hypothetical protein
MKMSGRPRAVTETCTCCGQTTSYFSYAAGRNPSGRKLTICLCKYCQALFYPCRRCKCLVRSGELEDGTCQACRQTPPGRPVRDIDERIRILAMRPMDWEERPYRINYRWEKRYAKKMHDM